MRYRLYLVLLSFRYPMESMALPWPSLAGLLGRVGLG